MKHYKYDYCVYIGRFSPPHAGHINTITSALDKASEVIIVIGTHDSPRTIKNPFTSSERETMIRDCISSDDQSRLRFVHVADFYYQDSEWVKAVQSGVSNYASSSNSVAIIGNRKDDSSYYLNYFKNWKYLDSDCITVGDTVPMSSTKIRELMFEGYIDFIAAAVHSTVLQEMRSFSKTPEFLELKKEYDDGVKYEKMYENIPYGTVNFVTVDAVVVQSGHVLLIKRKASPGAGLYALPGGHLNNSERIIDGAIRELREETGLKIPAKVLRGSVFHSEVFDHPDRSLRARLKTKRGRSITHAYGFKLDDSQDLPRVSGKSDALEARWFTFDEISNMRSQLFEDHASIIDAMLARLK